MNRIFRMKDLCRHLGLSRSTIYRLIASDNFPKPIKIGFAAVGWDAEEVSAWLASRREAA